MSKAIKFRIEWRDIRNKKREKEQVGTFFFCWATSIQYTISAQLLRPMKFNWWLKKEKRLSFPSINFESSHKLDRIIFKCTQVFIIIKLICFKKNKKEERKNNSPIFFFSLKDSAKRAFFFQSRPSFYIMIGYWKLRFTLLLVGRIYFLLIFLIF